MRVFTGVEPELPTGDEPEVPFEPLVRVVTTGLADAAGATAPAPLVRVRAGTDATALAPDADMPEEAPPAGPVPAAW